MRSTSEPAVPRWPNWLGLVVDDLDGARRFYADVLGREPDETGDDWAQFDMGDGRIFELLRRDPDQIQYDRARFQPGFAVDDIADARERLLRLGARQLTDVEGGPEHGGVWCYFRDPQGHVFELSERIPPAPDSPAEGVDGLR
jgi:catechol 2,3-dioxygenase-like lactoylglutathione lyase family enzyme